MFGTVSQVFPAIGIDTLMSVVLPTMTTAFLIFFFRQSTKMFPRELIEAGRIDGVSEIGIFIPYFYADDENNICGSGDYYFYGELE